MRTLVRWFKGSIFSKQSKLRSKEFSVVQHQFSVEEDLPRIYPPIGILLKRKATKGTIGLEIECEGNSFKKEGLPAPWTFHVDHSLRGQDNAEYVLAKPIEIDRVPEALDKLWGMFEQHGTVLADSNRTSTHVHLNVQDWYLNRLTSFLTMYFCVEELLTAWCGEHRIGNLFCLRAKDAPAIVSHLRHFIRTDGRYQIPESFHYAGLNAQALFKFGSLEIRTLRGPTDKQVILDWVSMLERLYTLSAEYDDPRDICGLFSSGGPMNFLSALLGPQEAVLRGGISYTDEMIRDAMYYGIRLVQDLVYCRDWVAYKPTAIKADPFGRDPMKALNTLSNMATLNQLQNAQALAAYAGQEVTWATQPGWNPPEPVFETDEEDEDFEPDFDEDEEDIPQ
jgi:hypothetical protein